MHYPQLCVLLAVLYVGSVATADEPPPLYNGPHSLTVSFDGAADEGELYHVVDVRNRAPRLTLVVRNDDGSGGRQRGLGSGAGSCTTAEDEGGEFGKWKARQPGQEAWLSRGRRIHGSIEEMSGEVRFGFTLLRDGKLVSLHFVGRTSGAGATGEVYLLSATEPAVEGTWELHNPGYLFGGFNGAAF